jgi:hypothetical protein
MRRPTVRSGASDHGPRASGSRAAAQFRDAASAGRVEARADRESRGRPAWFERQAASPCNRDRGKPRSRLSIARSGLPVEPPAAGRTCSGGGSEPSALQLRSLRRAGPGLHALRLRSALLREGLCSRGAARERAGRGAPLCPDGARSSQQRRAPAALPRPPQGRRNASGFLFSGGSGINSALARIGSTCRCPEREGEDR